MHAHSERGQSLVMFAVLLPALMGLMAIGVDAGMLFIEHRRMQSAADLAALAGARSLPDNASSAMSTALAVAGANGYSSGVTVTTPYSSNTGLIEVEIEHSLSTYFMPLLGMASVDVGVRAVARATSDAIATYAIFAGEVNCGSNGEKIVDWGGSDVTIKGAVHSNGGMLIGGSNNSVVGATTYHCMKKFENGGSGNSFTPAPQRQVQSSTWPISYTAADFPCTYSRSGTFDLSSNGAWWVGGKSSSKQLNPGVYCATGSNGILKLNMSDVSGTVTFVAGYQIEVSGSNFDLTAYRSNVLAFSQGNFDNALKLNGSGGSWAGILYAPNGTAEMSGSSNLSISGGIVAEQVKLNGSSISIDATALSSATAPVLQLIE